MIEWQRYVVRRDQGRPVYGWIGWISGRPLYNIQPRRDEDGLVLRDVIVKQVVAVTTNDSGDALVELKRRADQHRAELTGGLFP
jgi:hypothetical protein